RDSQPARANRDTARRYRPAERGVWLGPGKRGRGHGAGRAQALVRNYETQVVRTISTEHGAWWETLFGTEPSRNRLAPVIPLLPTTIRSQRCSSATSTIASAASPTRANVSTSATPPVLAWVRARSSSATTSSWTLVAHCSSSRAGDASPRTRGSDTGSYALTMC